ncbi:GNAT family N-acetyltransferase [Scatolibacter rhodanostii]|uniref:GNAT family N-acetyltransferase n=1 Tax=Scatolibacter rhodanostii TaxID=2014781 RepID=UPI000C079E10|nr:GNAT family N-acetyltransferase [Scatolibacter rhodanostii]
MNEFRILTEEDADSWYDVLHKGYVPLQGMNISFEAIDAPKKQALTWFAAHPVYGFFADGQLVSAITLRMPWGPLPGPDKVPHIGWFVTDPAFQGKGYAKQLLAELEEKVLKKQLKTPFYTLGTAEEHPWLVEMYESMGFKVTKTVQLNGKKHHTVFMKKELAE